MLEKYEISTHVDLFASYVDWTTRFEEVIADELLESTFKIDDRELDYLRLQIQTELALDSTDPEEFKKM